MPDGESCYLSMSAGSHLCRDALRNLNPGNEGMLLAVSGGMDSMAMLHDIQTAELVRHGRLKITVGHLNHNLRGMDSEADEDLVSGYCRTHGVPFVSERLRAGLLTQDRRGSSEEAARRLRYEFLERTSRRLNLPFVVTAHHQRDQVETILFSLLRGCGLRGLQGIPSRRALSESVSVIRPLLQVAHSDIDSYVRHHQIPFRSDASNDSPEFARNRIRKLFASLHITQKEHFQNRLLTLSEQAIRTANALDVLADQMIDQCVCESSETTVVMDQRVLQQWPEPIVRHALTVLWSRQEWPRQQMNRTQWQRLSTACLSGVPRRWTFPGGIELVVRQFCITLHQTSFRKHSQPDADGIA